MQSNLFHLLDLLFTIIHILIIVFNLFGWIWEVTRKLHFYMVCLTACSWLVLGFWFGFGYCPITDWQWQVKDKLGERNLPNSFIKYVCDKLFDRSTNAEFIDITTGVCFGLVAILSVYFNFFHRRPLNK
ncbi:MULTISPECIES: DUF2784 domain-containing protein [Olivibacter]|uniref:DUF2784 domain-containing protein n=1 Tax=Olivibacter oleidegradans TaxID=760123 RepID=A0ABV6HHL6_9SPHI|nr:MULTISPECIES: DUF2784 domain-containing protein [Olivibacter]MDM8176834.1 DUF2784 domain-containing protein [Olivibacter sp. 47]QEL00641.1 DUF2784 domain-containing protein [Olivibacter sp. LS-1]